MARFLLHPQLAERIVAGRAVADELPAGLDRVAALLEAARQSSTANSDFSRLEHTVAAMSAAVGGGAGSVIEREVSRAPRRSYRAKLAAGSVAGLFSLFGGLAAAGALPSAAQNGIATAASHVGIDLPHGHGHGHSGTDAGTPGSDKGKANKHQAGTNDTNGGQQPDNHGACVSQVAQDHTSGSAVATVAQSDCGKPAQAQNPTPGGGKPDTSGHGNPNPQSQDHGKPATVPSTVPSQSHGGNANSQGGTHGNGH